MYETVHDSVNIKFLSDILSIPSLWYAAVPLEELTA